MTEQRFAAVFARPPTCSAEAPGRVNLMGEHTDYNGGLVLPTAIPQRARVLLALRQDETVRAASAALGGDVESYALGSEKRGRGWLDYLQGITFVLARAGQQVQGFDAWIDSSVPMGSGLSSSAAFEIAVLRGLRTLLELNLDDVELAQLGQQVENDFVGANVGIMDQMAASLADEGTALLIDTLNLHHQRVTMPLELELAIIDSGIRHSHASGDYNERRRECEEAAARLGVRHLCELTPDDLWRAPTIPELLARRAHHVVTENARVLATAQALAAADERALGEYFAASHASQRDNFAVSLPELDRLVNLACEDRDVVAARLTGGGFGGSVVLLVHRGMGRDAAQRVVDGAGDSRARVVLPIYTP